MARVRQRADDILLTLMATLAILQFDYFGKG